MKKVRMPVAAVLVSVVLLISFRSSRQSLCINSPQYYKAGTLYLPVNGVLDVDYTCWLEPINTCTYYRPNPVWQPNYYVACKSGTYLLLPPDQ